MATWISPSTWCAASSAPSGGSGGSCSRARLGSGRRRYPRNTRRWTERRSGRGGGQALTAVLAGAWPVLSAAARDRRSRASRLRGRLNVSRAIIPIARNRFDHVSVLLVSAAPRNPPPAARGAGPQRSTSRFASPAPPVPVGGAGGPRIVNIGDPVESAAFRTASIVQALPPDRATGETSNAR
jgi:hypothetical protein